MDVGRAALASSRGRTGGVFGGIVGWGAGASLPGSRAPDGGGAAPEGPVVPGGAGAAPEGSRPGGCGDARGDR